jgi:hypothetical protein
VLKQVFIFFINHSVWQEVVVAGNPNNRCAHCSGFYNTKIFLFGGITSASYLDAHLYGIETGNNCTYIVIRFLESASIPSKIKARIHGDEHEKGELSLAWLFREKSH